MVSLKNQIRWCIRAELVLGGMLVVIGSAFYFFGYRPTTNRLATMDKDIANMQQELADNSLKSQILPNVAKDVKTLRLKLDGSKKLPHEMDVAGFVTDVMHISQNTQLGKPDYKPEDPKHGELFSIYPIRLQLRGTSPMCLRSFVRPKHCRGFRPIRSIDIKADGKQPGTVIVNLGIDLYFSTGM